MATNPSEGNSDNELMKQIAKLKDEKEAIRQEFTNGGSDANATSSTLRTKLATKGGDVVDSILHIAIFEENVNARLKAATWVAEVLLGIKGPQNADEDSFKKLLSDLTGKEVG